MVMMVSVMVMVRIIDADGDAGCAGTAAYVAGEAGVDDDAAAAAAGDDAAHDDDDANVGDGGGLPFLPDVARE
eukprot:9474306-Pyramimonas_sp.AAC.1